MAISDNTTNLGKKAQNVTVMYPEIQIDKLRLGHIMDFIIIDIITTIQLYLDKNHLQHMYSLIRILKLKLLTYQELLKLKRTKFLAYKIIILELKMDLVELALSFGYYLFH